MFFAYNLLQHTKNIPTIFVLNQIKKKLENNSTSTYCHPVDESLLSQTQHTYTLLLFNYIVLYANPPSALLHTV